MPIPLTDPEIVRRVGHSQGSEAGRRKFGQFMEQRQKENLEEEFGRVERGWYLREDEFKQYLLVPTRPMCMVNKEERRHKESNPVEWKAGALSIVFGRQSI